MKKIILLIVVFLFLFFPKKTYAVRYDLMTPSGTLQRGQTVTFTINIDTQGKSLTSAQIGVTYETQYLEFINVTPGNSLSAITSTKVDDGKLLVTGSSTSGFSGQGIFAYVNFKLIATASGSTELCALWAPAAQPTPTVILPTKLPNTGNVKATDFASFFGISFIILAGATLIFVKKIIK